VDAKLPELRDRYQPLAQFIVDEADRIAYGHGMRCRIAQAYRDAADQDRKFAQGFSKVRGGYSWHQYHLAFDLALFDGDDFDVYIDGRHPRYAQALDVYEEIGRFVTDHPQLRHAGVFWGGRFPEVFGGTFTDLPHYEWHPPYSVRGGAAQVIEYKSTPRTVPLDLSTYPTLPLTSSPTPPMPEPTPEPFVPTREQSDAYDFCRNVGIFTDQTPRNAPMTTEMFAVMLKRAADNGLLNV